MKHIVNLSSFLLSIPLRSTYLYIKIPEKLHTNIISYRIDLRTRAYSSVSLHSVHHDLCHGTNTEEGILSNYRANLRTTRLMYIPQMEIVDTQPSCHLVLDDLQTGDDTYGL